MQHLPPIPDNLPQLGVESAEASSDQQQHDQPENTDQILYLIFWTKLERDILQFKKIMKFSISYICEKCVNVKLVRIYLLCWHIHGEEAGEDDDALGELEVEYLCLLLPRLALLVADVLTLYHSLAHKVVSTT